VPIKAIAEGAASDATVAFPAMNATDNVTPEPTITCAGAFNGSPLTFLAKDATAQRGVFFIGSAATTVSCVASDDAGNTSPAVNFTVAVACGEGFAGAGAACKGAADADSEGSGARGEDTGSRITARGRGCFLFLQPQA
jgi:hypothetical protein